MIWVWVKEGGPKIFLPQFMGHDVDTYLIENKTTEYRANPLKSITNLQKVFSLLYRQVGKELKKISWKF